MFRTQSLLFRNASAKEAVAADTEATPTEAPVGVMANSAATVIPEVLTNKVHFLRESMFELKLTWFFSILGGGGYQQRQPREDGGQSVIYMRSAICVIRWY